MDINKKKILIISEVFYPEIGSGANRITKLVMILKKQGYLIDVVTSEPSYPNKEIYINDDYRDLEKEKELYENSRITRVKGSSIKRSANFFTRLYMYIFFLIKSVYSVIFRKSRYDMVIATIPSPFCAIVGIIAKFRFRCKFILDIRDLWPECLKNIGLFRKSKFMLKIAYIMEKIILKFSNSIIINSYGFREYLINKNYNKEIVFIPNGLQRYEIKKYSEIKNNINKNKKFTVIYTGIIGLPQNIKSIVKAARFLKHVNDLEFKIIGTGVEREKILKLIEEYELKNIKVYDPMPKNKIVEEVAKSHIALAHLRKDSAFDLVIPGKIIDYMGVGIPIVAGVEGYAAQVIKESNTGIVVEPDDYKSMAKAINKIYKDKKLQEVYTENCTKYCIDNFCTEDNFEKYTDLIESVIRRSDYVKEDRNVRMESFHE